MVVSNDGVFQVILVDLPARVKAFVLEAADGFITIYINSRLSFEMQRRAYDHEVRHIRRGDIRSGRVVSEIEMSNAH